MVTTLRLWFVQRLYTDCIKVHFVICFIFIVYLRYSARFSISISIV